MKKPLLHLPYLVLLIISSLPAFAQQAAQQTSQSRLRLEPFAGLHYSLIASPEKEVRQMQHAYNGNQSWRTTYAHDQHTAKFGLQAGLRAQLRLNKKWGIGTETALQQIRSHRTLLEQETLESSFGFWQQGLERNTDIRLLYFSQSLEGSYTISPRFSARLGAYAATLLSSYQEGVFFIPEGDAPASFEEMQKAGYGLRDTQLGLQASLAYQPYSKLVLTAQARQSLQSIYSSEAQPAGAVRLTYFSLTAGYRFEL